MIAAYRRWRLARLTVKRGELRIQVKDAARAGRDAKELAFLSRRLLSVQSRIERMAA